MALESADENPASARDPLTVSALNRAVAGLLARGFPLVRVRGEIGNLTRAASGHWYFTLKDDAAQVRCVMFRSRNALVDFALREGDAVEVLAQVGLYEPRGEFQLTVESVQRAGQGRLYEEFLKLKARLAAEGLFDDARKRPLPALPQAIGVVTSLQAAALRDVVTALRRRAPYARVIVYPVPVQGAGAGERIAAMLQTVSARAEVDVVLLVRGGGSIEDLWAFNEEVVARAIRACARPVVVGVGHDSDYTIADFAADLRAPTPTAAAEMAAPDAAGLGELLRTQRQRLRRHARQQLDVAEQRVDYALRLLLGPRAALAGLEQRIAALRRQLRAAVQARLATARQAWLQRALPGAAVTQRVAAGRGRVREAAQALRTALLGHWQARAFRVRALVQALSHLDPGAVLERGYALARDAQGRLVTDAAALAPGDALQVQLARGAALTRVERVEVTKDGAGKV